MANGGTLAAARERKSQRLAAGKANSTTVLTRSSSPDSTQSTLAAHSLHSIKSQTAMTLSSDDGLPSSISLPAARSKSKRISDSAAVLSDDASDVIAKPRKRGRPAKVRSDSEIEEVAEKPPRQKPGPKPRPKAVPKKGKPVKKKKAPVSDSESVEVVGKEKPAPSIVLMVPEATSEGSQRLAIQATISFEDALELIHETIGCVSVVQKPTLAYKLSTANQKSATINLRTVNDWDGLVTDAKAKMATKKDLSVAISVFPDNYMASLRATMKKQPAASTKKKGKMTIMDLNNTDSAGEDDDDEAVADGEKRAMAELDAEYRKCMRCCPTYVCKIDRSGEHVHLSFNQRRAWAVSMACGTNNVTKTTPPQGDLFTMFHRKAKEGPTPVPAGPSAQYHPYYPYPMLPLFGDPQQAFPRYHHAPPAPQLPSGPAIHPHLSSDPPEEDVSYPSIIDFIATLIHAVPQRADLRALGDTLDSLHFYQINEIVSLTVDDLGTERFGPVAPGDATYVLERVRREFAA
ncbi:hypothetical protein B0H19DRAFT_1381659 [Mycena capillaripes]|nr:hypothetical protein B0H19DRAFT_1381659 [Mycena capillaripes]